MKFTLPLFPLFISAILFCNCTDSEKDIHGFIQHDRKSIRKHSDSQLREKQIRHTIESLKKEPAKMYVDDFIQQYYNAETTPFLWITRAGVNHQADSLIACIETQPAYGIPASTFHMEDIKKDLNRIRHSDFNKENDVNTVFGRVEYRLTQALIRYACGQQYGFLRPDRILNRLERTDPEPKAPFKILYDIPTAHADYAFVQLAASALKTGSLPAFLHSIQPDNPMYGKLAEAYRQATSSDMKDKIAVNLERCRWKTEQRPEKKYVWVNLAGMVLHAVNETQRDTLEMKVCGGGLRHKSPMLISKIERMDLNPYWLVPYNIVKKEIAPLHAQDVNYFSRNRIRIFDKQTGEEMDPQSVTADMLTGGNYRLRQDNGNGNSLGRLIFRFPNNFSVYLHDTNNKGAFKRSNRAISHGCIRVERPLELALFLWENSDEKEIDKLRTEIGLPPLHGKKNVRNKAKDDDEKTVKVGTRRFNKPVPIFIHYHTVYPNLHDSIDYHPDIYGYDDILLKKLKAI